ncbi:MAG: hypothetical protein H7Y17_03170 [Chlorobia bacterium]|nr:hypothetical protein [Fimbriimonadaceae bacterium]
MTELTRNQKAIQWLLIIILVVIVVALSLFLERIFVSLNMISWVADVLSICLAIGIVTTPFTIYLDRKKRNEEQPP